MKTGYSLLLSEYIAAERIVHGDCKTFQIVCPACKEPVFKVERTTPPPTLHYLSHYNKDASYAADCELRVSGISSQEMESANSASRGQRLEYFLSVLKDAIFDVNFSAGHFPENADGPGKMRKFITEISVAPGFQMLRDWMLKRLELFQGATLEEELQGVIEFQSSRCGEHYSEFTLATRKRIALDIWTHLFSAKARSNLNFLYCASYAELMIQLESALRTGGGPEFQLPLHQTMMRITEKSRSKAMQALEQLDGIDLRTKLAGEITHLMLMTLVRIPYLEMLKAKTATKESS